MSLYNLMMLVCIAQSSCVWDADSCRDDCDEIAMAQICSEFTSNMFDCEEAERCDWFDDTDSALSSEELLKDDATRIIDTDGGANHNEGGAGEESNGGDSDSSVGDGDAVTTSTLPPSTTEEEGCCLHRGNDRENMACSNMGSKKCDIEGSCEWVTEDPECAKDHTVDGEDADEASNVAAGIIDNDSGAAAATDGDEVEDEVDEDGSDDQNAEDEEDLDEDGRSSRSIGGEDEEDEQFDEVRGDEKDFEDDESETVEESNESSFGDGDDNEDEAGDASNVSALEAHLTHRRNRGGAADELEGIIDNDSGAAAATDKEDEVDDDENEEDLAEDGRGSPKSRSIEGDLTHRRRRDDVQEQALFADTANSTQRNKEFPGAWSMILIGIVAVLAVRSWNSHKAVKANSIPSQVSDYGAVSIV